MARLLGEYGIEPDMVMGHSLGEYGALVSAGVLTFGEALEAAAARGREMSRVSLGDNGAMAAVMGPIELIEEVLEGDRGLRGAGQPERPGPERDRRRDRRRWSARSRPSRRGATRRSACR